MKLRNKVELNCALDYGGKPFNILTTQLDETRCLTIPYYESPCHVCERLKGGECGGGDEACKNKDYFNMKVKSEDWM